MLYGHILLGVIAELHAEHTPVSGVRDEQAPVCVYAKIRRLTERDLIATDGSGVGRVEALAAGQPVVLIAILADSQENVFTVEVLPLAAQVNLYDTYESPVASPR